MRTFLVLLVMLASIFGIELGGSKKNLLLQTGNKTRETVSIGLVYQVFEFFFMFYILLALC